MPLNFHNFHFLKKAPSSLSFVMFLWIKFLWVGCLLTGSDIARCWHYWRCRSITVIHLLLLLYNLGAASPSRSELLVALWDHTILLHHLLHARKTFWFTYPTTQWFLVWFCFVLKKKRFGCLWMIFYELSENSVNARIDAWNISWITVFQLGGICLYCLYKKN